MDWNGRTVQLTCTTAVELGPAASANTGIKKIIARSTVRHRVISFSETRLPFQARGFASLTCYSWGLPFRFRIFTSYLVSLTIILYLVVVVLRHVIAVSGPSAPQISSKGCVSDAVELPCIQGSAPYSTACYQAVER